MEVSMTEKTPTKKETPKAKSVSLADIQKTIEALVITVTEHAQQIVELQATLAKKRRYRLGDYLRID
jgi:hypothetical protein